MENNKEKTIFRVNKNRHYFVMMDKRPLNNPELSYKAKGILAYCLSKPDDWEFHREDLINRSTDGKSSVDSGLKELENAGHIQKVPERDSAGRFVRHVLNVFEVPQYIQENCPVSDFRKMDHPLSDFPEVDNPEVDNPEVDNRNHTNTDTTNKDLTNIESTNTEDGINNINNNKPSAAPAAAGNLSKENNKKLNTYLNRIGWDGDASEVFETAAVNCGYVFAWAEATLSKNGTLKNPAGFFRKNIRSGRWPKTEDVTENNRRNKYEEDLERFGV